jgi:hypothetical protein
MESNQGSPVGPLPAEERSHADEVAANSGAGGASGRAAHKNAVEWELMQAISHLGRAEAGLRVGGDQYAADFCAKARRDVGRRLLRLKREWNGLGDDGAA